MNGVLGLQAPKTCYNFLMLAKQGKYNDCLFHRLVPGFMVCRHPAFDAESESRSLLRYKQEIRQVREQADSLTGEHRSATSMTCVVQLNTIAGAS
jgi:cyclophilin family peptidyl-prolyl cis-trans isomerase